MVYYDEYIRTPIAENPSLGFIWYFLLVTMLIRRFCRYKIHDDRNVIVRQVIHDNWTISTEQQQHQFALLSTCFRLSAKTALIDVWYPVCGFSRSNMVFATTHSAAVYKINKRSLYSFDSQGSWPQPATNGKNTICICGHYLRIVFFSRHHNRIRTKNICFTWLLNISSVLGVEIAYIRI